MGFKLSSWATCLLAVALLCCSVQVAADSLDEGVQQDSFLLTVADALGAYDIDVTSNLNSREVVRQRIQRPRLGRFPDLPIDSLASSEEIASWETAYRGSELGGVAILIDGFDSVSSAVFTERWLQSGSEQRLFVTFYADDLAAAEKLADVAADYGHAIELVFDVGRATVAAELYATAAQRLAIDSRVARRYRTKVTELEYLGERVRRKSNSLFVDDGNRGDGSLARREPSVFLKETLGDEFNQSTIEAIIVPGGVALGEVASLGFAPTELVFRDGELALVDEEGMNWRLPEIGLEDAKALFDFVARSEVINSDAIVDIDADGKVQISSVLRDTDVGFAIMHADTQPFKFVPNLRVTKSVIIDIGVDWQQVAEGGRLQFEVDYEVRFLSADNMRIAQTQAALEYQFNSAGKTSDYLDSWGRYASRLDEKLDYSGLGQSMTEVATYAGWIGLFRRLHEDQLSFLRGRYEFMKIDKSGQRTPSRY
ncbi:MAG: hypothetical protein COB20_14860 [SAR86 cluster bacterium]|uniref:Uncharacterized protein n=1 Tax=SAR86 cluster bacterium TaxID=2030880 RepID=A0A2A4WWJ3_9GAMM|nr:MAG: hypothetical protein COB20_14860 [SAR86 cluster bacterium]